MSHGTLTHLVIRSALAVALSLACPMMKPMADMKR